MISVVIPTYNRGYIIKKSIESVLKQNYKNLELIIVDDNSNDNTQEVIESIRDERVKYIKLTQNKGACYARNIGVEKAKGEYIAFQDSDDIWHSDKLQKQKSFLIKNDLEVIGCKMAIINTQKDKRQIFPEKVDIDKDNIYYKNYISTQLLFGKKECFLKEKFDERLPRFQDWELIIRLAKRFKVAILDEVLVDTYIQDNSITKSASKAVIALEIFLEKHKVNNLVEANYLRLIGLYKLQDNEDAFKYFRESLIKNPRDKKILVDYFLSAFRLRKIHYNIYRKKGRFS